MKVIWRDGQTASLYLRRLEKGRFLWPSPADGVVAIAPAQMEYLLSGIDWRNPRLGVRLRSDRALRLVFADGAASSTEVTIAHLKLMIEKLKRELYGQRSERTMRFIDQMELSSRSSRRRRPRTNSRRKQCRDRRHCLHGFPVVLSASPFHSICRASGSSSPRQRHARAAAL
ncbi:hypothetical protein HMPREF9946_04445 [Acetobacteraceae bacterium AT-5844]|nr:hypothetical protein HMPREF9946_04445 [Acetobacteraceae bacterium AT-5844]